MCQCVTTHTKYVKLTDFMFVFSKSLDMVLDFSYILCGISKSSLFYDMFYISKLLFTFIVHGIIP